MSEVKIHLRKDGTFITHQEFSINGQKYHIVNEGPYEIRNIGKLRMRLRKMFRLKNEKGGIVYEK